MAQLSITIDAAKVQRFLGDAPEKVAQSLSRIIQRFSFLVEREAKIASPVDTGRLRGSINTELHPLKAIIMPNVNYAIFVHEGTRFMRARPFMKWGLQSAEGQLSAIIDGEVKEALD